MTSGKTLSPGDHTDSDVSKVLRKWLKKSGWTLVKAGHWGRLECPCGCTSIAVAGTPRSPTWEAKRVDRLAARCPLPRGDGRRSLFGRKAAEG